MIKKGGSILWPAALAMIIRQVVILRQDEASPGETESAYPSSAYRYLREVRWKIYGVIQVRWDRDAIRATSPRKAPPSRINAKHVPLLLSHAGFVGRLQLHVGPNDEQSKCGSGIVRRKKANSPASGVRKDIDIVYGFRVDWCGWNRRPGIARRTCHI